MQRSGACPAQASACSPLRLCARHTFCSMSVAESPSMVQPTDWQVPTISFTVPFSSRAMLRGRMMRAIAMQSPSDRFPSCAMFLTCVTRRQSCQPRPWLRSAAARREGERARGGGAGAAAAVPQVRVCLSARLLAVTRRLLQRLDDQRGRRGDDGHLGNAVLHGQLHRHAQALPVLGRLLRDVLSNLLGRQTQGTCKAARQQLAWRWRGGGGAPILGASEEAAPTSPPSTRTKTSMEALGSNLSLIHI